MKQLSILIFLLSILATGYCFASNRPGAATLTLAEAYYHFSSKRPSLDNATGMPNVALAYNFNDHWAAEAGIGVINTNQTTGTHAGVHGFLYNLDALYRFDPRQHFEPYVLAGIGMMGLKPADNQPTHQGNVNIGAGTEFFIDKSIALRGELRDIYTMVGGKNEWMVNFGVSFLIGGKPTN